MQSEASPEAENQLAGAESQQNEVRVQYTEPDNAAEQALSDQDEAASGGEHASNHTSLEFRRVNLLPTTTTTPPPKKSCHKTRWMWKVLL